MESGFLGGLRLPFVRPLLLQCAEVMGSEAIVTGRNIKNDMCRNTDPNAKIRDSVVETCPNWRKN